MRHHAAGEATLVFWGSLGRFWGFYSYGGITSPCRGLCFRAQPGCGGMKAFAQYPHADLTHAFSPVGPTKDVKKRILQRMGKKEKLGVGDHLGENRAINKK